MALPVETFQIKTEGLPRRCEVCHQDDLFDPLSGHCGRCSALVFNPVTVPGPPAPVPADYKSGWLNATALIGSGLIGLFGLGILLLVWVAVFLNFGSSEFLFAVGFFAFSGFGYHLLFLYFQIFLGEVDSSQFRWAGMATVVYNLLIFIGVAMGGLYLEVDNWFGKPFVLLWLAWTIFMMFYGCFLIRRERAQTQPVN